MAAPEKDDSLVFWLFVLVSLAASGWLTRQLIAHGLPVVVVVFAGFTSWTGLYMSLGHLYEIARRIKGGSR